MKQKIKIRKNIINKVNNAIHGEIFNKLCPNAAKILIKFISRRNNKNKLKSVSTSKVTYKIYKDVFSEYMPLISNISPISKIKDNKYKQRSLNKLILK